MFSLMYQVFMPVYPIYSVQIIGPDPYAYKRFSEKLRTGSLPEDSGEIGFGHGLFDVIVDMNTIRFMTVHGKDSTSLLDSMLAQRNDGLLFLFDDDESKLTSHVEYFKQRMNAVGQKWVPILVIVNVKDRQEKNKCGIDMIKFKRALEMTARDTIYDIEVMVKDINKESLSDIPTMFNKKLGGMNKIEHENKRDAFEVWSEIWRKKETKTVQLKFRFKNYQPTDNSSGGKPNT
jgi:hypothetical protein